MSFNIREAGKEASLKVISEMAADTFKRITFGDEFEAGTMTIREMIGTDDGAREFVEKITYDMAAGRDAVNLVYKQIYQTRTDANFPETMSSKSFGQVQVVFLQKFEGGEIKFGTLGAGIEKTVSILTWATGVEYDEDIVEYNQTWRVSDIGLAFGDAYNKLLNNLHMAPILAGVYDTAHNSTLAAHKAAQLGDLNRAGYGALGQSIAYDTSIAKTLQNALTVLPNGSKLLINSLDIPALENAIAANMNADLSPAFVKRTLQASDFIVYEGTTVVVGGKSYVYAGVPAGTAFLVTPNSPNFVEYVKHDLRVDSDNGDLSRLILAQVVGRTRRGVFCVLGGANGAVKIALA